MDKCSFLTTWTSKLCNTKSDNCRETFVVWLVRSPVNSVIIWCLFEGGFLMFVSCLSIILLLKGKFKCKEWVAPSTTLIRLPGPCFCFPVFLEQWVQISLTKAAALTKVILQFVSALLVVITQVWPLTELYSSGSSDCLSAWWCELSRENPWSPWSWSRYHGKSTRF